MIPKFSRFKDQRPLVSAVHEMQCRGGFITPPFDPIRVLAVAESDESPYVSALETGDVDKVLEALIGMSTKGKSHRDTSGVEKASSRDRLDAAAAAAKKKRTKEKTKKKKRAMSTIREEEEGSDAESDPEERGVRLYRHLKTSRRLYTAQAYKRGTLPNTAAICRRIARARKLLASGSARIRDKDIPIVEKCLASNSCCVSTPPRTIATHFSLDNRRLFTLQQKAVQMWPSPVLCEVQIVSLLFFRPPYSTEVSCESVNPPARTPRPTSWGKTVITL